MREKDGEKINKTKLKILLQLKENLIIKKREKKKDYSRSLQ